MGKPVVHWEIGAKDVQKLEDFFSKLFDWRIETGPGNYGLVHTQTEEGIGGGIFPVEENMPSYVTFYVQVEDLQTYLDKAEGLGGKTLVPPTPIPETGAFAVFADPEGHAIGLFQTD